MPLFRFDILMQTYDLIYFDFILGNYFEPKLITHFVLLKIEVYTELLVVLKQLGNP